MQISSQIRLSRDSIKNAGKEILSTISKSSKNTPIGLNKKIKVSSPSRDIFANNSLLIRDKINITPGYGLWCTNIKENRKYDKLDVSNLITSGIKNFSENEFKYEIENKTIDTLKLHVSDLIAKLEKAVGDFHEANVKALRAEELKDSYHKVAEDKIREWKEVTQVAENIEKENVNLKEALNNSTKEIARLNYEIKHERERCLSISESFKLYEIEKEISILNLTNQLKDMEEKVEILTVERNNLMNNRRKNTISNKNDNETLKNESKEDNKIGRPSHTPKSDVNELTLKLQLEIVDLKNKIIDDESHKNKLMDVIKSKKIKIKNLKSEKDKVLNRFEECSKDIKWNHDLVSRKQIMIKNLKDELNHKDEKEKNLLKEINHLKCYLKPKINEVGVQKNDEEVLIKLSANPKFFA